MFGTFWSMMLGIQQEDKSLADQLLLGFGWTLNKSVSIYEKIKIYNTVHVYIKYSQYNIISFNNFNNFISFFGSNWIEYVITQN